MIKLSKNLEWFRPYIDKVGHLVPIEGLEKIISIKPRKNQIKKHHAQLVEVKENGKVRRYISLNLYSWRLASINPTERKILTFSKVDLLEYLAHELAHLVDWNHTPEHKTLEAKIKIVFMKHLKSTGYISEEHELKTNPPKY